jgi:hypothetical protein
MFSARKSPLRRPAPPAAGLSSSEPAGGFGPFGLPSLAFFLSGLPPEHKGEPRSAAPRSPQAKWKCPWLRLRLCPRTTSIDFACLPPSAVSPTGGVAAAVATVHRGEKTTKECIESHQHVTNQIVAAIEMKKGFGFEREHVCGRPRKRCGSRAPLPPSSVKDSISAACAFSLAAFARSFSTFVAFIERLWAQKIALGNCFYYFSDQVVCFFVVNIERLKLRSKLFIVLN